MQLAIVTMTFVLLDSRIPFTSKYYASSALTEDAFQSCSYLCLFRMHSESAFEGLTNGLGWLPMLASYISFITWTCQIAAWTLSGRLWGTLGKVQDYKIEDLAFRGLPFYCSQT